MIGPLNATVTRSKVKETKNQQVYERDRTVFTLRSKENHGFDESVFDGMKHVRIIVVDSDDGRSLLSIDGFKILNRVFLAAIGEKNVPVMRFLKTNLSEQELTLLKTVGKKDGD